MGGMSDTLADLESRLLRLLNVHPSEPGKLERQRRIQKLRVQIWRLQRGAE